MTGMNNIPKKINSFRPLEKRHQVLELDRSLLATNACVRSSSSLDSIHSQSSGGEEDMVKLWILFKDIEKNLTLALGSIVTIEEFEFNISVAGQPAVLKGTDADFKRGTYRFHLGSSSFVMPDERFRFMSKIKGIPQPSASIRIPPARIVDHDTLWRPEGEKDYPDVFSFDWNGHDESKRPEGGRKQAFVAEGERSSNVLFERSEEDVFKEEKYKEKIENTSKIEKVEKINKKQLKNVTIAANTTNTVLKKKTLIFGEEVEI
jgi:hypothetical protein